MGLERGGKGPILDRRSRGDDMVSTKDIVEAAKILNEAEIPLKDRYIYNPETNEVACKAKEEQVLEGVLRMVENLQDLDPQFSEAVTKYFWELAEDGCEDESENQ